MPRNTRQGNVGTAGVPITVSIDERYLDQFDAVVRRCKRAGLHVEHQLRTIGVISGSIDPAKVRTLENIEGVRTVEQARSYQLPPSGSDIQ